MCSTIMNLLSLANEDSVPGADDFVPVLVFVLIRVSFQTGFSGHDVTSLRLFPLSVVDVMSIKFMNNHLKVLT